VLGHVGLPMKFFYDTFDDIRPYILEMLQVMMGLGQLSEFFNHGLIVLILKLGEHSLMGN
jgi:hypothetical protein